MVSMTRVSDCLIGRFSNPQNCNRGSPRAFVCVSALVFVASVALTIVWCRSMSAMGRMPMPGGWIMSMAWMRMPGQSWFGASGSFVGMWTVMMLAMMMPSLVPMLTRYRRAVEETGKTRLGRLTALVGSGYFFVWTVFGVVTYALGVALSRLEMQQPALARAVPISNRCGDPDRRSFSVHVVQGASPGLLPAKPRVWPNNAGRHRDGLAAWSAPWTRLQLLLC
jgi:hypothetical protein